MLAAERDQAEEDLEQDPLEGWQVMTKSGAAKIVLGQRLYRTNV